MGARSILRHRRGASLDCVTPCHSHRSYSRKRVWEAAGQGNPPVGFLGGEGGVRCLAHLPRNGHLLARREDAGAPITAGCGWCWRLEELRARFFGASGRGEEGWEGRLAGGWAPDQLSTLSSLPSPRWICAGPGPVLLAGGSRDSARREKSQKQNGSKPAMCMELLLAQGLHLIPSTPAL